MRRAVTDLKFWITAASEPEAVPFANGGGCRGEAFAPCVCDAPLGSSPVWITGIPFGFWANASPLLSGTATGRFDGDPGEGEAFASCPEGNTAVRSSVMVKREAFVQGANASPLRSLPLYAGTVDPGDGEAFARYPEGNTSGLRSVSANDGTSVRGASASPLHSFAVAGVLSEGSSDSWRISTPWRWFGIRTNASSSTRGKCFGSWVQHAATIVPRRFSTTSPDTTSPNKHSRSWAQRVTK